MSDLIDRINKCRSRGEGANLADDDTIIIQMSRYNEMVACLDEAKVILRAFGQVAVEWDMSEK